MRDTIDQRSHEMSPKKEMFLRTCERLKLTDSTHKEIVKYTLGAIERAQEKGLGSVEFPIDNYEAKFDEIFAGSEPILVEAGTGAGKSLTLGAWTLGALEGKVQRGENTLRQRPRVAMTQPRKDAAQGVCIGTAARFEHMDFGKDITFATSEFKGLHDDIPLQIQTTKMLVNRFRNDPMLLHYDAVVVDEAHERSIDSDVLLGLLKRANRLRAQNRKPLLKIVVASATIDIEKFQNFLEIDRKQTLSVEGRMYPVEEHFLTTQEKVEIDEDTKQEKEIPYTTLAAKKVIEILTTSSKGDILVFIPGDVEITSTINQIRSGMIDDQMAQSIEVLPLHGKVPQYQREDAALGGESGKRRVIVATNIAETSLTVPNIEYVIDAARQKETYYDPAVGLTGLAERPASQAACNQRKGRAGRVKPGDYYSLLTKEEFNALPEFSKPEIQRGELGKTCLELLESGITDLEHFDFIDPPEPERLKNALDLLSILGAIDEKRKVTEKGKRMAEIPFDARMSAVVYEAEKRGCVRETLGAYYFLQEPYAFEKIRKNPDGTYAPGAHELEEKIRAFAETCTGDWDRARKLFFGFYFAKNQRQFCEKHGLQYKSLVRVANKYVDGWKSAKDKGVLVEETLHEGEFRQCLLAGLAPDQLVTNVGRKYRNQYTAVYPGSDVGIARGTALSLTGNYPSLAVAATLQGGKRGTQNSDGGQDFFRFYAAGVQPVTTKDVRTAVPHLVRKNPNETAEYSMSQDGKVVVTNRYEFLTKTGGWVGLPLEKEFAPAGMEARRALAEYVRTQARYSYGETADKLKAQFHLEPNAFAQEIRTIDALYQRSRGAFAWAGYDQWFEDQFGDCTTLSQVQALSSERFVLSLDAVCPHQKQEAIQQASPDSLYIGDTAVPVQYAYTQATDKFIVTVDCRQVPESTVFEFISQLDETAIRKQISVMQARDVLLVQASLPELDAADIESLKKLAALYERQWLFEASHTKQTYPLEIERLIEDGFPDITRLAGEYPSLPYGTTSTGEILASTAGIAVVQKGSSEFDMQFVIRYFSTEEEALESHMLAEELFERKKTGLAEYEKATKMKKALNVKVGHVQSVLERLLDKEKKADDAEGGRFGSLDEFGLASLKRRLESIQVDMKYREHSVYTFSSLTTDVDTLQKDVYKAEAQLYKKLVIPVPQRDAVAVDPALREARYFTPEVRALLQESLNRITAIMDYMESEADFDAAPPASGVGKLKPTAQDPRARGRAAHVAAPRARPKESFGTATQRQELAKRCTKNRIALEELKDTLGTETRIERFRDRLTALENKVKRESTEFFDSLISGYTSNWFDTFRSEWERGEYVVDKYIRDYESTLTGDEKKKRKNILMSELQRKLSEQVATYMAGNTLDQEELLLDIVTQ